MRLVAQAWRRASGPAGSLRAHLVTGTLGAGGLGVAQRLLQLVIAVVLARLLGADRYGIYAYAGAIALLLAVPAQLGLPQLIVREIAAYRVKAQWGHMRGLLHRAMQVIVLFAVVLVCAGALAGLTLSDRIPALDWTTFAWALALVPLSAFAAAQGAALQGLHRVVVGQLPEKLLRPVMFLSLLGAAAFLSGDLQPHQAMILSVIAAAMAFVVAMVLLWRMFPAQAWSAAPSYETRRWLASAFPFSLLAGIQLINNQTDIIMLGFFTTAADVGVYRVVTQGAMLVAFSLVTVNVVLAPNIARLHAESNRRDLQRLITVSVRAAITLSLLVAAGLIVFGTPILETVFGQDYVAGSTALTILCMGQLANVGFGSVGLILNMTGYERDTVFGAGLGAVANVALNLWLIPIWGMEGAAVATALSLLLWNVYLSVIVYRRTELVSTAITRRAKRFPPQ